MQQMEHADAILHDRFVVEVLSVQCPDKDELNCWDYYRKSFIRLPTLWAINLYWFINHCLMSCSGAHVDRNILISLYEFLFEAGNSFLL